MSIRQIAATVSRELRRNTTSARGYLPHTAHRLSVQRWRRSRTPKLIKCEPLRNYVHAKLQQRWSPEQISHRLPRDFPDSPEMRVATETIYQAIYVCPGPTCHQIRGSPPIAHELALS